MRVPAANLDSFVTSCDQIGPWLLHTQCLNDAWFEVPRLHAPISRKYRMATINFRFHATVACGLRDIGQAAAASTSLLMGACDMQAKVLAVICGDGYDFVAGGFRRLRRHNNGWASRSDFN